MHKIFGILFWAFRADCDGSVSSEYALLRMREINCAWSYFTQRLWQVSFSGPVFTEVTLTPHSWNGKRSETKTLIYSQTSLLSSSSVSAQNGQDDVITSHFRWLLTPCIYIVYSCFIVFGLAKFSINSCILPIKRPDELSM